MSTDLLFMPDYAADPLWSARTECMVNLDRIPVSEATRAAVRDWAQRWEQLAWAQMHRDDVDAGQLKGPAEPVAPQAWEQIDHDGRALCEQLRNELGPDWRVGYVTSDQNKRHVQWETEGPIVLFLPGTGRSTGDET